MSSELPENSLNVIAVVRKDGLTGNELGSELQLHSGALELALVTLALSAEDRRQFAAQPPDTAWLSARLALQHEAVSRLARASAVFPLQFGVVTESPDELLEALRLRSDELDAYFALVEGCSEWSLRLTCPGSVTDPQDDSENDSLSGLEWLRRRKAAPELAQARQAQQSAAVRDALARSVLPRARAAIERSAQVEPPGRRTVLQIALLLPDFDAAAVQAELAAISATLDADLELSLTGPWAAYSFRPRIDAG